MARSGRRTAVTLALLGAAVPMTALAQPSLSPAFWDENIVLSVPGGGSDNFSGSDLQAPESHASELSAAQYELAASVDFPAGGPPRGAVALTWDIAPNGPSVQLVSTLSIDFQFAVVVTGDPPPGVTEVPVRVVASGEASVEGEAIPAANAVFRVQAPLAGILITDRIDADDNGGTPFPTDGSFALDQTEDFPVDEVVLVGLSAAASATMVSTAAARVGHANAAVDQVIEIADELIPGTSERYRDHFGIVFSEGYDALTPVEPISMGGLKRRFGGGR